jgi:hypothetical protein
MHAILLKDEKARFSETRIVNARREYEGYRKVEDISLEMKYPRLRF